jgi:hypothetical protein
MNDKQIQLRPHHFWTYTSNLTTVVNSVLKLRCWMTSCLNNDYLILIFIHFPYLLYENPSFTIVSAETEYFSTRSFDDNGQLSTKIYDKRDDFNFKIINFPNMCSNIPASPAYGVYISQLIRIARASSN